MSLMVRCTSSRVVCTVSVSKGLCAFGYPPSCMIRSVVSMGVSSKVGKALCSGAVTFGQKLKRRETGCGEGNEDERSVGFRRGGSSSWMMKLCGSREPAPAEWPPQREPSRPSQDFHCLWFHLPKRQGFDSIGTLQRDRALP